MSDHFSGLQFFLQFFQPQTHFFPTVSYKTTAVFWLQSFLTQKIEIVVLMYVMHSSVLDDMPDKYTRSFLRDDREPAALCKCAHDTEKRTDDTLFQLQLSMSAWR